MHILARSLLKWQERCRNCSEHEIDQISAEKHKAKAYPFCVNQHLGIWKKYLPKKISDSSSKLHLWFICVSMFRPSWFTQWGSFRSPLRGSAQRSAVDSLSQILLEMTGKCVAIAASTRSIELVRKTKSKVAYPSCINQHLGIWKNPFKKISDSSSKLHLWFIYVSKISAMLVCSVGSFRSPLRGSTQRSAVDSFPLAVLAVFEGSFPSR